MDMELAQEEFMGSNDLTQIVKGKRTKRQRSSSPPRKAAPAALSSSSSSGVLEEYGSSFLNSSPTSSSEVYESTEEEEDMANCLILLAQGDAPPRHENSSSRKFFDVSSSISAAPTTTSKAGFYVYECKTCNRSFPSFQALGGHRASHKKPKPTIEEKRVVTVQPIDSSINHDHNLDDLDQDHHAFSLQVKGFLGNNKSKIHECSICGSEFTSGQALGGHMRRHRASNGGNSSSNNNNNQVTISESNHDHQIKPRNILPLDLNLPAPEDDHHHRESKFQFASTQPALVFPAPALVDCHY